MNFTQTNNRTWRLEFPSKNYLLVAFEGQNSLLIKQAYIDIDDMDGSRYDSDGDEKKLLVTIEDNQIVFETLAEDFDFWHGTESNYKQGSLGYVLELIKDIFNTNNVSNNIEFTAYALEGDFEEVFLWDYAWVKKEIPELLE